MVAEAKFVAPTGLVPLLVFPGLHVVLLGLWWPNSVRAIDDQIAGTVEYPSPNYGVIGAAWRSKLGTLPFIMAGTFQ